eukprot:4384812-Amphidinium_carterae.1
MALYTALTASINSEEGLQFVCGGGADGALNAGVVGVGIIGMASMVGIMGMAGMAGLMAMVGGIIGMAVVGMDGMAGMVGLMAMVGGIIGMAVVGMDGGGMAVTSGMDCIIGMPGIGIGFGTGGFGSLTRVL